MKKLLLYIFTLFHLIPAVFAQQDPQLGQYMQNKMFVNPAAAGSEGGNLSLLYRSQWIQMPGGPKTIGALADVGLQKGVGLGLTVLNTSQGLLSSTRVISNYSYKVNITEDVTALYLGLQAGLLQYRVNTADLILHDPISQDATFNNPNGLNKIVPDFGFGTMLKLKNLHLGFALPHILQSKIKFMNAINTISDTTGVGISKGVRNSYAKLFRHYYFMGGGDFVLSPLVSLQPSFLMKMVSGAPLSLDLNMNVTLLEKFWGGVGYRLASPGGGVIFMAGLNIKTLKFGYAYEVLQGPLHGGGGATHELMVTYQFKGKPEARPSKKPYFLK